jgi:putative transposase
MSARANPYHNARTESFMGTLKNEMLQGSSFTTESNARLDIFDLIESCYSHHRKPNAPGYRPSAQFDTETHPNN